MIIWKQRMSNFSFETTLSSDIKEGKVTYNESTETTHYSIVVGLVVNNNINDGLWWWTGLFPQQRNGWFQCKPGEPNMFGLVGNEANSIAPQNECWDYDANYRRENGKLFMVVGSPGGSTISISMQTILNVYEHI
jgi:gamma-glutamyltranspeptidase/glutathione hydrolase